MMAASLIQVDAFTDRLFGGNPAAVCLLECECGADWMQSVAAEMNLAETAFVRRLEDGFELRWFTPTTEVNLCGHATLASAYAMWSEEVVPSDQSIRFHTKSGLLTAQRKGGFIELDFPATPPEKGELPAGLLDALGIEPIFFGKTKFDFFLVVESEETVRSIQPDMQRLAKIPTRGVIVTSRSDDAHYDFVSRFFAPAVGVDEDPVTGSAHCCLGPYWSHHLAKQEMKGFQASPRGGVVRVSVKGDRVVLGGQAVAVFKGTFL